MTDNPTPKSAATFGRAIEEIYRRDSRRGRHRLSRVGEARESYGRALQLTQLEPERRFIERRLDELA